MMAVSIFVEQNLSTNNDKSHVPMAEPSGTPIITAAMLKPLCSDDIPCI
jgi:hypothetical protein